MKMYTTSDKKAASDSSNNNIKNIKYGNVCNIPWVKYVDISLEKKHAFDLVFG